jgi:hypothetical protein
MLPNPTRLGKTRRQLSWVAWGNYAGAKHGLGALRLSSGAISPVTPHKRGTERGRNSRLGGMNSTRHKPEFPPLLEPGLHDMSAGDLKTLVVDKFPLSKRRAQLWENLIVVVSRLRALNLPCKIWIDGSFLTEKIDPDDVDFVVDLPIDVLKSPDADQGVFLHQLAGRAFHHKEKLHSFIMFSAPVHDVEYPASVELHEQWKRDFGFSYVKKEPKGIAILEVQP